MKYRLFVCIFCLNSSLFLYNLLVICSKISSKSATAEVIDGDADSTKRRILEKMASEMMEEMSENHVDLMSSDKRVEVPLVAKDIAIFSQNLNEFCGRFLTGRSYTSRSSSFNNIQQNATNSIWRACSFKPADDIFETAARSPRPNVTLHLRAKWLHYMDNLAVYVCYVDGEGVKTGRELSLLQPKISGQSAIVEHSNWSIYDVNALLPLDDQIYDLNSMVFAFVYRITDFRQLSTILLPRLYISYYEDASNKLKNAVYADYCQTPPTFSAAPSSLIPPIRHRGCCLKNVRLNLTEAKWSKMIHYPQTLNVTICRAYDHYDEGGGVAAGGGATARIPAHLLNECCETHQYKPFTVIMKSKSQTNSITSFIFRHVDAKSCILRC